MKYWMFLNNQVTGPYDPDDLPTVSGYSAETLVCSEGRKGTNMGDWQRASMIPELSVSLLKVTQLATVLKGSGAIMEGLPPEPTLKDLAALGSLQEKVSVLDNTVGQLQESLKLKETELLSLHREIDEKDNLAKALAIKLGTLEERLNAVNALKEGLDKAAAAEHDVQSSVQNQARTIEDLTRQLSELQTEKARLEGAMAGKQDLEELKEQVREIKERPAPMLSPSGPSPSAMSGSFKPAADLPSLGEPKPMVDIPVPAPSPFSAAGEKLKPLGAINPEPFSLEPAPAAQKPMLNPFSEVPVLIPNPIPATIPPSVASAAAAAPSVVGPQTAAGEGQKKSSNVMIFVVLALGAAGAFGALRLGLIGGQKRKPSWLSDRTPVPPPIPAESGPPVRPTEQPPEDILEQKKKNAVALVQAWPAPGGKTVGVVLAEGASPSDSALSPWLADKLHDDVFQVNFYSQKPGLPSQTFEFEASLADRSVTAHNAPAQDLLSGKATTNRKPPRRKGRKGKTAKARPAGEDKPILEDILIVNPDDDKATPAEKAPVEEAKVPSKTSRKSRVKPQNTGRDLDDLLSDSSEPAPKPKAKPKAKAPRKEENLDELLVPGSGRKTDLNEPQAQPAPMRNADDAEAAADEGAGEAPPPAQKSKAAGTDAVLDDLLKP